MFAKNATYLQQAIFVSHNLIGFMTKALVLVQVAMTWVRFSRLRSLPAYVILCACINYGWGKGDASNTATIQGADGDVR